MRRILQARGHSQDLRHVPGAQGHRARDRARRARLLPRAFGLRQDDAAAHHRRARDAGQPARIVQGGRDISRLPPMQRDYGIVFQSYALFPNLTIVDNVAYGLVNRRKGRDEIAAPRRRAAEAGRPARTPARSIPAQLSGGQQQRIALARALATSPGSAAARRAAVRARRARARAPARRDPRAAAAPRRDDDHGHARPGRGAVDGRPHRRDEPRRDRAGRHAAADLPRAGDAVRRRLRRQDQRPIGAVAEGGGALSRRRAAARRRARRARPSRRAPRCGCTCGPKTSSSTAPRDGHANAAHGAGRQGRVPRRVLPCDGVDRRARRSSRC